MRHGRIRRRWAAILYVVFGVVIGSIALISASAVLAIVATLSFLLAPVALDRFPGTRDR